MIEKFAAAWPSLRQVIYLVFAASLGVAFMFGWVTVDQQTDLLEQATKLLGIVGLVLAAFYVPKAPKVIGDKTDVPVEYSVRSTSPAPSITIPLPSVEQITSLAGPTIAELRARVEQTLGRRPGD